MRAPLLSSAFLSSANSGPSGWAARRWHGALLRVEAGMEQLLPCSRLVVVSLLHKRGGGNHTGPFVSNTGSNLKNQEWISEGQSVPVIRFSSSSPEWLRNAS